MSISTIPMETLPTKNAAPPKLRVGFVMHVMQVAGAEVLVTQIIERLSDNVDSTVFCLDAQGELGQRLRDAGIPVVVLDRKPGLDRQLAGRLANEVRERKIDVLHAHQYTPFFYSALARMRYRLPVKILFTEHGRHYPDVVSAKRYWANRLWLQRYADIATACCDFSAKALREIEGFPQAVTLANGVDLSDLPPRGEETERLELRRSLGLQEGTPYAACIARFHEVKDHPTLIRAWEQVHQQCPQARLLLVGDGEERQACEQLADQLGLSEVIEFWGIRNDVAKILRAVDVFTLTSVSEAASLTLLEAMASECPVVVTDVGGNAEHVTEGVEGYLAPRADSPCLGRRLTELLSDRERARSMGKSARQRVEQDFNLAGIVAQYADHYSTLASTKAR